MKPSEKLLDSAIQAIMDCAGPDAIASHMAEPIARAVIAACQAERNRLEDEHLKLAAGPCVINGDVATTQGTKG